MRLKSIFVFASLLIVMTAIAAPKTSNIELKVPKNNDPDEYYLEIKNDNSATVDFSMKLNGNFSLNTADLIATIRALPEAYKGEPDYVKVWRYIVTKRYHFYPLCGQYYQHDPSFFMNSMGFGLCDDSAFVTASIWRAMGYESRVWGLSGHVVPEIKINNRWELYDPDLEVIYYKKNGQVAGVEELAKNPALVKNPVKKTSKHSGAYCENVKNIYATAKNNKLSYQGFKNHYKKDFILRLPAHGTLAIGTKFYQKDLNTFGNHSTKKITHAKLTIPAHWTGVLDIPLAVHTILGGKDDYVTIKGTKLKVASADLAKYLNRRTVSGIKSLGTEPGAIKISDNKQPIEIIYLLNPRFTELKELNKLQLTGKGANYLSASLKLKNSNPLLGYWKFDEGSGKKSIDSGPNKTSAILLDNAAWTNDGKIGKAILFKGPKGGVELKSSHLIDCFKRAKAFTIQLWIKPDSVSLKRQSIFSAYAFDVDMRGSTILVYFKNSTNKYTTIWGKTKLKAKEWTSITVTYSRVAKGKVVTSLYINAKECGSKSSAPIKSSYPVRGPHIGYTPNGGGYYFNGVIDEVKILNKALTAKEIIN
jgi:Concanavalin A-like lectin/glucanases superfamily